MPFYPQAAVVFPVKKFTLINLNLLLTYLGLLQLEHRPSTIPLQHTRFWAASHAPFQLSFWALSSACVTPPTVAGSTSPSLPLGIPTQGLSCYVGWWFPQRMAYPALLPLEDLFGQRFLPCSFPQVSVAYSVWPSDAKDTAKTGVDKALDLLV